MAAAAGEREPRKRRERRDSGCAHERKQRAHSEERAPPHHPPPLHDHNRLEVERRAERLSRARRPQYGKRRRAAPRAPRPADEGARDRPRADDSPAVDAAALPLPLPLPTSSLSAPTPARDDGIKNTQREENLDLGALYLNLGRDEPEPSPAAERLRPPPSPPPQPAPAAPAARPDPEHRLEKIKKKIATLKRSISKHESDFEAEHGHPMGRSERMTDVQLTHLYEGLQRLQTEKRCIRADPAEYALRAHAARLQRERDERLDAGLRSDKPMADLVKDIEEWLDACRAASGRGGAEGSWSAAQLAAEKASVQRALLRLEAARGRPPAHSADRGAARPLYDRYRAVKRALAHISMGGVNGELATIHEHEPMQFNTSVDSSSESAGRPADAAPDETPAQSPGAAQDEGPSSASSARSTTASDEPEPAPEGLHCLALDQLARLLFEAKAQKAILRRTIKESEAFEVETCRVVGGGEAREEERARYRALKARIKLLNALINKQRAAAAAPPAPEPQP